MRQKFCYTKDEKDGTNAGNEKGAVFDCALDAGKEKMER